MELANEILEAVEATPIRGETGETFQRAWERRLRYAEDAIQIILIREARARVVKLQGCLDLLGNLRRGTLIVNTEVANLFHELQSKLKAMKELDAH